MKIVLKRINPRDKWILHTQHNPSDVDNPRSSQLSNCSVERTILIEVDVS